MSLYNFLELPPEKLREVYRLICQFDLACNKLSQVLETSTIIQVRQEQLIEGLHKTQLFINSEENTIAKHLADTLGKEFLDLNPYTQMFVVTYQNAVEAAKDWLVDVMELPLWAITKEIDETAAALANQISSDDIALFFLNASEGLTKIRPMETVAA